MGNAYNVAIARKQSGEGTDERAQLEQEIKNFFEAYGKTNREGREQFAIQARELRGIALELGMKPIERSPIELAEDEEDRVFLAGPVIPEQEQ